MKRQRVSARVRANRRNAEFSTGPKTEAGKARSSQNARIHWLRAGGGYFHSDARVTQLATLIAGPDARSTVLALAENVAEAHLDARLARRLGAAAWRVLRDDHPMRKSLVDTLDDPVLAEVYDPDERALIRGDHPVNVLERRLVARIEAYALKLRRRNADELTRRIDVLSRYEGRALARLRAASAALGRLLAAPEGGGRWEAPLQASRRRSPISKSR